MQVPMQPHFSFLGQVSSSLHAVGGKIALDQLRATVRDPLRDIGNVPVDLLHLPSPTRFQPGYRSPTGAVARLTPGRSGQISSILLVYPSDEADKPLSL